MRTISNITSVESNAAFQQKLLETFVQENLPPKSTTVNRISGMGNFSNQYKEIESCAAETPINGTVDIIFNQSIFSQKISVPVYSRFFVYCTRDDKAQYKVSWSSSLS